MPITSIISLNQIIDWFQNFQENHYFLKDFGFGEPYDIGTSRQMTFPYMWVTMNEDSNIATGSNVKSAIPDISFSVMFMDKINNQENYLDTNGFPSDNSQEILSDTLQCLQDLITEIQQNWGQYGVLISQDVSFYPAVDETQDKATGVVGRFVLRTRQVNCVIPEAPSTIVVQPNQATFATLLTCETLVDCPIFRTYAYTGGTYNSGTTVLTLTSLNGNQISVSGITGGGGGSGTSGSSGSSGTSGTSGGNGTSGTSGGNGTSGTSGGNGTSGTSGSSGANGTNGSSGTSGGSGTSGTSGGNGTSGTSGANGTSGTSGSSGANGSSGTSGSSGESGTSGSSGANGTSGSSGTSGESGTSGTSGTSGSSGSSGTSGSNGTNGSSGTSGSNGASNSLFNYRAKTNIISGDPTTEYIIWNNATQSSATSISISDTDQNGNNIDIFLSNLVSGTTITIQDQSDHTNYQTWLIGTPVDNSTYWTLPVTLVTSTYSFPNNHQVLFIITTTPSGTSGTSGSSGSSGTSGESGTSGTSGESGTSGANGTSGSSGTSGESGTSGSSGTSGTSGANGTSGTSGSSGNSGAAGTSGTSGTSPVNPILLDGASPTTITYVWSGSLAQYNALTPNANTLYFIV
jgi:hypothetical protein